MKKHILLLTLFIGFAVSAQEKLNAYKYVVVPSRFDFQKVSDEYGINTLLKYKFQQLGFEAFLDSEVLPQELKMNTCVYVKPRVNHKSTMIYTKISVEVLDCNDQMLFITQEGKSISKNYKVSNTEALRKALKSFGDYHLNFQPINEEEVEEVDKTEDVVVEKEISQDLDTTTVLPKTKGDKNFLFDGNQILFDKTNQLFYAEIKTIRTNELLGKISKTSKKGIYHVLLGSKNGVGYYDETGNFIVEFLEVTGNVSLHRFQLLN
jgi:hypothetical protein